MHVLHDHDVGLLQAINLDLTTLLDIIINIKERALHLGQEGLDKLTSDVILSRGSPEFNHNMERSAIFN